MKCKVVMSIDVGIKNLGVCVLKCSNKNKYEILSWKAISLMNDDNETRICQSVLKNGNYCKSNGLYFYCDKFYCGRHLSPDVSKSTSIVKDPKAKNMSIVNLGVNLKEKLDEECDKLGMKIDKVLIENQISPIANRMKTVQGMIMQYFIMRNVFDIEMISSQNKLKLLKKYDVFSEEEKKSYKSRKMLGIKLTEYLLDNDDNFKKYKGMFVGKKKDDLADAFLQGLWWGNQGSP